MHLFLARSSNHRIKPASSLLSQCFIDHYRNISAHLMRSWGEIRRRIGAAAERCDTKIWGASTADMWISLLLPRCLISLYNCDDLDILGFAYRSQSRLYMVIALLSVAPPAISGHSAPLTRHPSQLATPSFSILISTFDVLLFLFHLCCRYWYRYSLEMRYRVVDVLCVPGRTL